MKRVSALLATVAVAALATLAAPAAAAEDPEPHYATGAWLLQDWTGPYPNVETSEAALSKAGCDEVTLAKPDVDSEAEAIYGPSADGDVGTSYENTDLGLVVENGDTLVVDYELSHVDNAAADAVRMFAYDSADADTLNDAPTFGPAIAPTSGTTGTLTITFAADATVGTFGLTYDASNDTEGTVTFANLRLVKADESEVPIALCAKPAPEPSETAATTTTTTEAAKLPDTGANLTAVLAVGGALVLAGVGALMVARRRRA